MHLAEFRRRVAPLFRTTDAALRNYQAELCITETLKPLGMVAGTPGAFGFVTPATPTTAGLLILAGMIGTKRFTVGQRVARLWTARCGDPGGECAVTGADTFGKAIVAMFTLPELAEQLDALEIVKEYAAGLLGWRDGRRSTFHALDQKEWDTRAEMMRIGAVTTVAMLPGPSFLNIVRMMDADTSAAPAIRIRAPQAENTT